MRFEIEPLGDQVKPTVVHNGFGTGSAMLAGITEGWGSVDDETFLNTTADTLLELPGVTAVALGGSRAQGTARPDSDWDLAIYYRGAFAPQDLAAVGWPGQVSALGEWGGGVFNGGEWITNEKTLLTRAGLTATDEIVESLTRDPRALRDGIENVRALCRHELENACGSQGLGPACDP